MKLLRTLALAPIIAATVAMAPEAQAQDACVFERRVPHYERLEMGCTQKANPFGLHINWADGMNQYFAHHGDGHYTDKQGGNWTMYTFNDQAHLVHDGNGNRIMMAY